MRCGPYSRCHNPRRGIVWGVFFIAIGVLALLNNLHLLALGDISRLWPTVFCVIGVRKWLNPFRPWSRFISGAVFMLVGIGWTLQNFGVIQLSASLLIPIVLILAGVLAIGRAFQPHPHRWGPGHDFEAMTRTQQEDVVHVNATLSGVSLRCLSQDFKGGELRTLLGGIQLDLRQASITSRAELRVSAVCGGIQIRIPQDWLLQVQIAPTMGGVEDKTVPPPSPEKTLVLVGEAVMGGIEVKN
ncbi:MAG: hypothetical protein JO171_09240 [Paludibacterium sp.]|uniref:LiaI-LiaF-like domain-containing protein n=1 Tax=Paludibacterium sp. TaxID=1917523 RepID=UPI0025FA918C|nr:DUF5668 domain-containing protein [Paludibacterium sp.]MBV8047325.1 hypothetical protein [Paludibacterium sp.]MBV8648051.1 hypothetical protein [Paludibacterium sp.]